MRNPGLVAFAVTAGILAPVVTLQLAAGPRQREMLFAPGAEALDVAGSHITAVLDHRLVDPGETVHLDLTSEQAVEVGIVVFGSSGTEGERVPSPPLAVLHETVSLDAHATKHVALKLRGARASYEPVGTYSIYVMSPKAADRLALLQRRAGPSIPTGEIPDMDTDTSKLFGAISSIGRDDLQGNDAKLFGGTAVARLEAYTRAINPALALELPETTPANRPFTVGVVLVNTSKRAQSVKVNLTLPRLEGDQLGLSGDAAKIEAPDESYELAPGETKRVAVKVTPKLAGVLAVQAEASCVEYTRECARMFRTGALDAVQIVAAQPAVATAR